MENVKISLVCGLCQGCKTAIELAEGSNKTQKTTIFKEIVHNKNVNNRLKAQGILCATDLDEIEKDSIVIIRAHGEPPQTYQNLTEKNLEFLDGTCKNVKAIHSLVQEYDALGYIIVIVGKYGKTSGIIHPEVLGTMGYAKSNPILIEDFEDINKLGVIVNKKVFVVCQTTFNPHKFELIENQIKSICKQNNNALVIKNTICGAQLAILKASSLLANESDLMIVVGGKNSSNSLELFNNLSKICPSIFIEDINNWKQECENNNIKLFKNIKIGITAGASTDKKELEQLKIMIENYLNSL